MTVVPPLPSPPRLAAETVHVERLRSLVGARDGADASFRPARAVVLTVVTLGLYGFVCLHQLLARSGAHLRRRVGVLDTATVVAWERAESTRVAEELRPAFERTLAGLDALRAMTADFRDPGIWVTLAIVGLVVSWIGGLAAVVAAFVFLDADCVKHQRAERAVTDELNAIWRRLGVELPGPDRPAKAPQRYAVRIVASVGTFGLYLLWWVHDLMSDANAHVRSEWPWEDAAVGTVATGA